MAVNNDIQHNVTAEPQIFGQPQIDLIQPRQFRSIALPSGVYDFNRLAVQFRAY